MLWTDMKNKKFVHALPCLSLRQYINKSTHIFETELIVLGGEKFCNSARIVGRIVKNRVHSLGKALASQLHGLEMIQKRDVIDHLDKLECSKKLLFRFPTSWAELKVDDGSTYFLSLFALLAVIRLRAIGRIEAGLPLSFLPLKDLNDGDRYLVLDAQPELEVIWGKKLARDGIFYRRRWSLAWLEQYRCSFINQLISKYIF